MQTSVKVFACCLVGLLLLGSAAPSRAAAPAVAWKFKDGQQMQYVMERGVEGKMSLSGAAIEFKMSMTFDTTWNVKSVAKDGSAVVEQTVDRIQIKMDSPLGGSMDYDSKSEKKPEAGPVWAMLQPMVEGLLGQPIKSKITPLGQVSDIQFSEKMTEAFKKQQVGQNRQAGMGIGGNAFSERGVKELITKSVLPLPETGGKDATWTQAFENPIPGIGKQTAETTYSFAGDETIDGKKATKIVGITELTFEPEENPRAELEIVEQEAKATFFFDAAAGQLIKSSGTQKAAMELTGPQEVTQEINEKVAMYQGKSPDKPAEAEAKK